MKMRARHQLVDAGPVVFEVGSAMKFKVVIHPAEEGGFWAEIPALPGCLSEGESYDEVLANIREAAAGWIEVATDREFDDADAQVVEVEL